MLDLAQKFIKLDAYRQRLFIRAFFLLGFIRLRLLVTSFKALVAGLKPHYGEVSPPLQEPSAQKTARDVGWAVSAAAKFTPWKSTCLVQVLAAQRMLKKRRVAGVFFIGATNAEAENGVPNFQAHAWLKCGGEFITGESGHRNYTVISSFSWP